MLQHYQKVIGGKYSDFQARLSDCDPPDILSLAMLVDGTTEDSKYPNLLLIEKRSSYGV